MKKILSIILAVILTVSLIPATVICSIAQTVSEGTQNVIKVYNDNGGDTSKVTFKSLLGTTLAENTTYKLMEDIDLDGLEQSTGYVSLAKGVIIDGDNHSITDFKLVGGKESALFNAQTGNSTATVTIQNITFGSESAPIVYDSYDGKYDNKVGYALIRATDSGTVLTLNGVKAYVNGEYQCNQAWQEHAIFLGRNWGTVSFINCEANGTLKGHGYIASYIGSIKNTKPVLIENCVNNANITTDTSAYHAGFIALIDASATVTIKNSTNNGTVNGERYAGGFVAYTKGTLNISGCTNNGDVYGKKGGSVVGIGGIVGYVESGVISVTDTTNNGQVLSKATDDQCGGIVGYIKAANTGSTIQNCFNTGNVGNDGATVALYSGGIVAQTATSNVAIISCTNSGKVTAKNIAGGIMATSSVDITVTGCTNRGAVTTTTGTSWWHGAGGILGYTNTVAVTIQDCVNAGSVTGIAYAGGAMASFNQGENSKNFTVLGFTNSGTVEGTTVGGVIGEIHSATTVTVSSSANTGSINGSKYASGFIGWQGGGAVTVTDSTNSGAITGNWAASGFLGVYGSGSFTANNCRNTGTVNATNGHAGGVVSRVNIASGSITVNGFTNAGKITSSSASAAGVGSAETTADNSSLVITIERLLNVGDVYGRWNAGAAVGYGKSATLIIKNCVSAASITTSDKKADAFAKYDIAPSEEETGGETPDGGENTESEAPQVIPAVVTAENNVFVFDADTNNTGAVKKTLEEVWELINAPLSGYDTEDLALNAANTRIIYIFRPILEGCQIKTNDDGTLSIRFIGTVNARSYAKVGFKISVDGEEKPAIEGKTVTPILRGKNSDGTVAELTAQDMGGAYMYIRVLEGVSSTGTHVIHVIPFSVEKDGLEIFGTGYTVTVEDGKLVSAVIDVTEDEPEDGPDNAPEDQPIDPPAGGNTGDNTGDTGDAGDAGDTSSGNAGNNAGGGAGDTSGGASGDAGGGAGDTSGGGAGGNTGGNTNDNEDDEDFGDVLPGIPGGQS